MYPTTTDTTEHAITISELKYFFIKHISHRSQNQTFSLLINI